MGSYYKVWDELNSEEEYAKEVESLSAEGAALRYARCDVSGLEDGLYHREDPHPIMVRAPDGTLWRYVVWFEREPKFYASGGSVVDTKVVHCAEFVDVVVCTFRWGDRYGWSAWISEPLALPYKNECTASVEGFGETEEAAIADCIDNLRKCLRGEL